MAIDIDGIEYPDSPFYCFKCGSLMHEDGMLHVCNTCGTAFIKQDSDIKPNLALAVVDYE